MRLILSRKGFDSANGGIPSPILPDGRLCPLPIPDNRSPFRYDNIAIAGEPLGKLLSDLRPKHLPPLNFAHLDPDLDRDSMLRLAGWRPCFGQAGAACSHLRNQGVGIGDLFLFFGWFRDVWKVNGRYLYTPNSPDRHIIYGWLQVGCQWPVDSPKQAPNWVRQHIHFSRSGSTKGNEIVFSAAEKLVLGGSPTTLPGAGLLPKYHPSLCLTAPGQSRSIWRLPRWFFPEDGKRPLSYHGDPARWIPDTGSVILKTTPRGQEFVLHGEDYPKMEQWLIGLLTDMIHS